MGDNNTELKRGPWAAEEDEILTAYILRHGHTNWRTLPGLAGLRRCGKSCRLRWLNYLRPDVKRGNFTEEEEDTIIHLHHKLGNSWSAIASRLPGRTDNEIKNIWHTHLKKRLVPVAADSSRQRRKRVCSDDGAKSNVSGNDAGSMAVVVDSWSQQYSSCISSGTSEISSPSLSEFAVDQWLAADDMTMVGQLDEQYCQSSNNCSDSSSTGADRTLLACDSQRQVDDKEDMCEFWLRLLMEADNLPAGDGRSATVEPLIFSSFCDRLP